MKHPTLSNQETLILTATTWPFLCGNCAISVDMAKASLTMQIFHKYRLVVLVLVSYIWIYTHQKITGLARHSDTNYRACSTSCQKLQGLLDTLPEITGLARHCQKSQGLLDTLPEITGLARHTARNHRACSTNCQKSQSLLDTLPEGNGKYSEKGMYISFNIIINNILFLPLMMKRRKKRTVLIMI